MEIDPFSMLDGIGAGWWGALGVVLFGVEMVTGSFFLIGPGLAALAIALLVWIAPGLGGTAQVALFAVLAVALTVLVRTVLRRTPPPVTDAPGLNQRGRQLVGRVARVIAAHPTGLAEVEVDGMRWQARYSGPAPIPGSAAAVEGVDGMELRIGPLPR